MKTAKQQDMAQAIAYLRKHINNPPHPKRDGRTVHKCDSGYALRQEWI